jgi:hypothetical protein
MNLLCHINLIWSITKSNSNNIVSEKIDTARRISKNNFTFQLMTPQISIKLWAAILGRGSALV